MKRPNYLEIDKAYDDLIEERDMLADEARQMNEYLKRLDFLDIIDLEEDSFGWVLGTKYGINLNEEKL
jgi:hypothetical protein